MKKGCARRGFSIHYNSTLHKQGLKRGLPTSGQEPLEYNPTEAHGSVVSKIITLVLEHTAYPCCARYLEVIQSYPTGP